MRKTIIKSLVTLALTGGSLQAFSQANDWILPPSTKIHFTSSGATASSIGTTAIAGCGAGSGYIQDQWASTITDASGNGMTFIDKCGAYSLPTVSSLSSYSMLEGYQNVFAVPGLCKTFYAISWEGTGGAHSTSKLTIHYLNTATAGTLTETGSMDLLNDGTVHFFGAIAVAPLAADGTRRVYVADGTTLKYVQISATGTVGLLTNIRTGIDQVDKRSGFKVVDKGKKILMGAGSTKVKLYDIAADSFLFSYTFPGVTKVAGVEYLPYSGAGGDRIYVSYNYWDGTTAMDGFKYISYKTAPTTLTYAAATYPSSDAQLGFGYSTIERGKDGRLYIAHNDNFNTHSVLSGSGKLCVLDTIGTGTLSDVKIGGTTQVVTNNYDYNWGFVIQKQIQDEDYSNAPVSSTNYPTFKLAGVQQQLVNVFPPIYSCNGVLTLMSSGLYATSFIVKVEKGTISTGFPASFVPDGTSSTTSPISTSTPKIELDLLHTSPITSYLTGYSGPIRVSLTVSSGCGTSLSAVQAFQLTNVTAQVDFMMISPNDVHDGGSGDPACPSGIQAKLQLVGAATYPAFTPVAPFDAHYITPPCVTGWLGSNTVGITSNSANVLNSVGVDTFKVLVQEYSQDTAGRLTFRDTIVYKTSLTKITAVGYGFNSRSRSLNYFINNYNAIKNNYVYKVTYSIITVACGINSQYSYFKILDGMADGVAMRGQPTSIGGMPAERLSIFPNPASERVNVAWFSNKDNGPASLTITDVLGRIVLQQKLTQRGGSNQETVDISKLTPGIYHYMLLTANGRTNGSLVKQ